ITYIGACPGAHDPAIDAHLTPMQFLGVLTQLGIVLHEQPDVFDSVIPPDRRRHRSMPGGAPTSDSLRRDGGGRALHEIIDADWKTELAQRLLLRERAVFDIAPALGCHCAGARPGVAPAEARGSVVAIEPPRSSSDVIDLNVAVDVDRTLPLMPSRPQSAGGDGALSALPPDERVAPSAAPVAEASPVGDMAANAAVPLAAPESSTASPPEPEATPSSSPEVAAPSEEVHPVQLEAVRRRVAAPVVAHAAQAVPVTRTESGQVLPRAYAARRRTPSNGTDAVSPQSPVTPVPLIAEPERIVAEPERITAEPEPAIALAEPLVAEVSAPNVAEPTADESPVAETPAPDAAVSEPTPSEAPAPRQTPRSVVVPIPAEELHPVPPPPAADHARAAVITGVATVAIAVAAFVASRDDGRVSEESSGVTAPMSTEIDSHPLTFPLQSDTSASGAITDTTSAARSAPDSAVRTEEAGVAADSSAARAVVQPKRSRRRAITPHRRRADSSGASAVTDSLAREREEIRRELAERHARLDTIARSLQPHPDPPRR
ncbi:MAG: hypothetical protein M3125_06190, partial [Gemmatimonadota bacterium]|nr:hypothetical protein [Gemmatimonadota bacterium]